MFIIRGSTQIPTNFASGSLICSNVAITVQVSKHGSKVVRFDCCIRKLSANASLSVNRYQRSCPYHRQFHSLMKLLTTIIQHCITCQYLKKLFQILVASGKE